MAQGANLREWRRLWAALELADDFQFFAVHVDDEVAADCLGELLAEHCREQGLARPSFALTPASTVTELLAWLRDAPRARVFWLTSDGPAEALAPLFSLLNQKREVISETAGAPLVWAMHPMLWAVFRRQAPDFWSIHQSVFRFAAGGARLEFVRGQSARERRAADARSSVLIRETEPGEPTSLVGREAEVRWLTGNLQRPGARVLITGPGGIGKSALLRHVRPTVAQHYPDGVYWVKLDPGDERSMEQRGVELLGGVVSSLLPGAPLSASLEQLHEQFVLATERRSALFVFEDVEDPNLIPYLVPGTGSSLVVSSRHSSVTRPLFEFDSVLDLGPLSVDAAIALLLLEGVGPEVDVRQLAMYAGGNPLALLLTRALGRGRDDARDLRGLAERALAQLSPDAATLWPKLSLFHGRFAADDAMRLSSQSTERHAAALAELETYALLDRDADGFRFHDALRPLARARFLAAPHQRSTWQAFLGWMARSPSGTIDVRDAEEVSRWVQGIEGRLADDDWAALSDAIGTLMAMLPNDVGLPERMQLEAEQRGDRRMQALCYRWLGQRANARGDMLGAWLWHGREVAASCDAFGLEHEEVVAGLLAQVSVATGPSFATFGIRIAEVLDAANRAVAISRDLGYPRLLADALITRGAYELEAGNAEQAERDFDEGLALLGDAEADRPLLRKALWGAADIARARDDNGAAWAAYEKLLTLADDQGSRARVYYEMATLADDERALEYFGHALAESSGAGELWMQSEIYDRMADIAGGRGDLRLATHYLEQALAIDERMEDDERAAQTALKLAQVESRSGNWEAVHTWLTRAFTEVLPNGFWPEYGIFAEVFRECYRRAPASVRPRLREIWAQAGWPWDDELDAQE